MNTLLYTCPRCNNPVEAGAAFCASCGAQMAPMYQANMGMYQPNMGYMPRYAGFWIRVGAYLIDWLVLLIPGLILNSVLNAITGPTIVITTDAFGAQQTTYNGGAELVHIVVGIGFAWAYYGSFWTTTGQTLGMKALGLRVQRTDGSLLSWLGALGRLVMLAVSAAALCIGLIWVAFQSEKRGWHDLACDTVVVHMR